MDVQRPQIVFSPDKRNVIMVKTSKSSMWIVKMEQLQSISFKNQIRNKVFLQKA